MKLDATHNPLAQSWVEAANAPDCDFPIQNLPFGRFRFSASEAWRCGVAIGNAVLDLQEAGLLEHPDMEAVLALSAPERRALRLEVFAGLSTGSARQSHWELALFALDEVELGLPCAVADYTDFYTSLHHARAVGQILRPGAPLLPNYPWMPLAYHGRASSLAVSPHTFHRPHGQVLPAGAERPQLQASQRLDYELELGVWLAQGNAAGQAVELAQAEDLVWGLCLLNDWSARDLQAWEYQPLGPFLAKNFATTVSPWVVTLDALAPFRAPLQRPADAPPPLTYLDDPSNQREGALDIQLEVWLQTAHMRQTGQGAHRLSQANYQNAYWTLAQMVTQHTVNGCPLRPGDLLGTGTLSGPGPEQGGSLLELSQGGSAHIVLYNGETRTYLQDGDTVILKAYTERPGTRRIGWGECRGTVLAALA